MRIHVYLDSARLFRWHLALLELLAADGHGITVSFVDNSDPLPTSLTALFDYDRARSGATTTRFSTQMKRQSFAPYFDAQNATMSAAKTGTKPVPVADIALDLATSTRVTTRPERVLRPLYDGEMKDYALFRALLEQRAPALAIADSLSEAAIWNIGLPAIETPWRIATSFDQVTSRLVQGVQRVIGKIAVGLNPGDARVAAPENSTNLRPSILASAALFAASRAARKVTRVREKISRDAPKWHVAWRKIQEGTVPEPGICNLAEFRILPDDGQRFFADPFVFLKNGERHVFVEELPEATGRGHISHFTISAGGIASTPRPVLETPYHLSYPFVFEHGGEIWMLPESSADGGLDLYRAEHFPDRWTKIARLIEGRIHDATFFSHAGRLWIAAGSETLQSATWDGLSLYSADALLGPWEAHPENPVLIDARFARPAGGLWIAGGALYRPAQDCSESYGGGLTLRRVTELTRERFCEETVGSMSFGVKIYKPIFYGQGRRIFGPHTLSRAGDLEVIDLYARPSTLRGALRAGYRDAIRL